MEKMNELYEKVAGDSSLMAKFNEIMKDAETAGKETTQERLVVFAKEAGFEVSFEEISEFFISLSETQKELSDAELDMAAGGKGGFHFNLFNNPVTHFINTMTELGNTPVIDVFKK